MSVWACLNCGAAEGIACVDDRCCNASERAALLRVAELEALINSPEIEDFIHGIELEAAHQVDRWGHNQDAGKTPFDWFWLIGYLAQKAADAALSGDVGKAKHHTISTAAALANWHRALSGGDARMRPGIDPGIAA